jgi:hypothetical protein
MGTDPSSPSHLRYLLVAGVVAAMQIAATFWIATTPYFIAHSSFPQDAMYETKFAAHGVDADVVFVGDSQLAAGVDPTVIRRHSGLSAYNLGISLDAFTYYPEMLLDHYLATNKKPLMLVLYFGPWSLINNPDMPWYHAAVMVLRHGSVPSAAAFFGRNPWRVIEFPYLALATAVEAYGRGAAYPTVYRRISDAVPLMNGFTPFDEIFSVRTRESDYLSYCSTTIEGITTNRGYIDHFRKKYGDIGIATFFFGAPISDCDKMAEPYAAEFADIADNAIYRLPHQLFVPDAQRLHLKRQGALVNSELISTWLLDMAWSRNLIEFGKLGPHAEP